MTEHARAFVTPLTFQTLSRNPVACDLFADPQDWKPGHVSLAASADLVVVAPATANILAKMAHGIADDSLSALALACRKPKLVAPAMNEGMLDNPATRENLATLRRRGIAVMDCGEGELACGTEGRGRMPEPAEVLAATEALLG